MRSLQHQVLKAFLTSSCWVSLYFKSNLDGKREFPHQVFPGAHSCSTSLLFKADQTGNGPSWFGIKVYGVSKLFSYCSINNCRLTD